MTRLQRLLLALGIILAVPACATTGSIDLPSETLVPVPVPCEIEQVEPTVLPEVTPDMNIFEAAKTRMAQIYLMSGEITRLRAANETPCPTEIE